MLTKQEIERFLEHVRLYAPDHIIMLDVPVVDLDRKQLLSGLAGIKDSKGIVLLTPYANGVVFAHECLHTTGFGEFVAYAFSNLMYKISKMREFLGLRLRSIRYGECYGCEICLGMSKLAGKPVVHWVKG